MKIKDITLARYTLLGVGFTLVQLTRYFGWGDVYTRHFYPYISRVLSAFSGLFPFSLGDVFITVSILGIPVYFIVARVKKQRWITTLAAIAEYLVWVYVWFYLAWGLNYSQSNFYERTGTPYTFYAETHFRTFTKTYIKALNDSYLPIDTIDKEAFQQEVIKQYSLLDKRLGIHAPWGNPRVKTMLFSSLFSKMAITGYMGPFFNEFNVNADLPASQYIYTYAHELAHVWGISNEGEANFYAYQVCTQSDVQAVAFGGYFSILGYVLRDARGLMPPEDYEELYNSIKPEIIELAKEKQDYWMEKYSPLIGDIQDWIYNLYLKGNQVAGGTKSYSTVIGLLISWQERESGE